MEIYSLYEMFSQTAILLKERINWQILLGCLLLGAGIWFVLFLLQGFGLYKMAKNRNIKRKWLAFMPFANIYYMGKLAGETNVFGQRVKRAGLYAMIGQIISVIFCALAISSFMYLCIVEGEPAFTESGYPDFGELVGFSKKVQKFYDISGYIIPIFILMYRIFMLILLNGLYKKYAPKNYFPLLFLSFVLPESRFIVIFVLRNKKAIDFEAYMRARREAYMRQRQYHQYGNPYGNPYQNPYGQNPYNQGQNQQNGQSKQDDPFAEFSSDKKPNSGDSGQTKSDPNDPDQFFN